MIPNLSDQLPHWVGWVVPVFLPLMAMIWLPLVQNINLRLFTQPVDPDAHWTERARRLAIRYRVWGFSGTGVFICTLIIGSRLVGPLQVISAKNMVLILGGVLLLEYIWLYWRFNVRHQLPHSSLGRHFSLWFINVTVLASYLPVAVIMAATIPPNGSAMIIGEVIGLTLIFFGSYVFRLSMFRRLGFVQVAPERLQRVVDRAAEKSGHKAKAVYLIETRWANAYAYPLQNEIMFSSQALKVLNDDELEAVASHEIGHLKEGNTRLTIAFCNFAIFAVLGSWHPIVNEWGAPGMATAFILALVAQRVGMTMVRDREVAADEHATAHVHDETIHAQALQALYRFNLTPVVMGNKRTTHPDLYDRMQAAGLTPEYERPQPARLAVGKQILFLISSTLLVFGPMYGLLFSVVEIDTLAYETGDDRWVNRALACGAGASVLTKIGRELADEPEQAAMYLTAATEIKPKWWMVRIDLADTLEDLGRLEQAWQAWLAAEMAHAQSNNQSEEFYSDYEAAKVRLNQ
jgi:Zn-dependent protease with chaperone function